MSRKPWEIPIQYNEPTRLDPPEPRDDPPLDIREDDPFERLGDGGERPEKTYECNDATPLDYAKGPHDDEFDCSLTPGDQSSDAAPLDYAQGPHDDEFGVDDDETEE